MNKSELVKSLSEELDMPTTEAGMYIETFFDCVRLALLDEARVEIRGFGSFKIKEYDGYQGRNPKSGNSVEVPPKKLPVFRTGKELKDLLND